jgi:hypothetical protein
MRAGTQVSKKHSTARLHGHVTPEVYGGLINLNGTLIGAAYAADEG